MLQRDIVKILGVSIDNVTLDECGIYTKQLIEESNKSCKIVVAPNTEFIMLAQKDKEFFDILKQASFATPDSVGVMIGGKLQNKKFKERIPGQSYFRKVLEVGEKEGWTFYFLGGEEGIAQKAKEKVEKDYPNVKIIGCHEGFFEIDKEEDVVKEINKLQPNVLFVAMGAPIQEKWIARNKKNLKVDIATGQGGTFDYEAGKIKRAPKLFQKLGIEWMWRLIKEPKRIVRMMALPKYLITILIKKDKTKGKFDEV